MVGDGDEPATEWLLRRGGRPLFVLAHQDDETALAGIIQRVVGADERGHFVWWTNGDGLAPAAGIAPATYSRLRLAETTEALRTLGVSASRKTDLATSEIENYRQLTRVAGAAAARAEALAYFVSEADRVEQVVRQADPDRVFVLAWQGGHPEHDLLHVMTRRAVARLARSSGRSIPLVQCPAYEFLIGCALRFKPWYRGDRRTIELSPLELENKLAAFAAHGSQSLLFGRFRRVIGLLGWVAGLAGRGFDLAEYLRIEHFGVVDRQLDYGRSTHRFEWLDYLFDDYLGTPIRYSTMVRPVAEALVRADPSAAP